MSLRLKIAIAIASIVLATIVVLGDGVLHAIGLPRGFGRVTFLILLTMVIAPILGWQWLGDRAREKRLAAKQAEKRE